MNASLNLHQSHFDITKWKGLGTIKCDAQIINTALQFVQPVVFNEILEKGPEQPDRQNFMAKGLIPTPIRGRLPELPPESTTKIGRVLIAQSLSYFSNP